LIAKDNTSIYVNEIDVMIIKIFSPKHLVKKVAFLAQTTASFCKKKMIITLVFEKNAIFSPKIGKNRRKL
jgi:hypothetical protein